MAQANRHHGVTTTESTEGVRYISDISTAVIGMVCTADDADTAAFPLNKPVFYASAADIIGKAGDKGTLAKSLDGIIDQADAQIVIVRVPHDANADALKANIIGTNSGGVSTGIQALRRAKSACGFVPKILGAPELDSQAVAAELVGVAQATRAFVYASAGGAADLDEVKAYRANFGQREIMLVDNEFTTFDPVLKTEVKAATIARILGLRPYPPRPSRVFPYPRHRPSRPLPRNAGKRAGLQSRNRRRKLADCRSRPPAGRRRLYLFAETGSAAERRTRGGRERGQGEKRADISRHEKGRLRKQTANQL